MFLPSICWIFYFFFAEQYRVSIITLVPEYVGNIILKYKKLHIRKLIDEKNSP